MLNYANLNDVEFEYLCQDIMSRKLGVELRRFAPGRDGGIDLVDDLTSKNIVVQVKHYVKTDANGLINSLRKEVNKVENLKPKKYYVCCSKELTPDNTKEILDIFNEYMESEKNIITLQQIEDFLLKPENDYILRKHYKLWISSTGILENIFSNDVFADSLVLMSEIDKQVRYFVQTEAYDKALKCLENNRPLFLVGDPGVGKTITSKMLVLHFASVGYFIKHTTNVTDIGNLKKSLSSAPNVKEIILLDDCLGQAYFNMKESQGNELLQLIKYVNLSKNKLLILNSRVTIFEEAKIQTPDIVSSINDNEFRVHIINMQKISLIEKAKILYNHLFFSEVDKEYFDVIRSEKFYKNIIEHKNYNPRIIEFITSKSEISKVSSGDYRRFIQSSLDNPNKIWESEYDRRLSIEDRTLLLCLYSLTENSEDYEYVKKIYNDKIMKLDNIDKTKNHFEMSMDRLQRSFIKIVDNNKSKQLSVMNPSINDFLNGRVLKGTPIYNDILGSSKSIKQLKRLMNEEEFDKKILEVLLDSSIENFIFKNEKEKRELICYYMLRYKVKNISYMPYLYEYLDNFYGISISEKNFLTNSDILSLICNKELFDFYKLSEYFANWDTLCSILCNLDFMDLIESICNIYECLKVDSSWIELVTELIEEKMEEYCDNIYADDYSDELESHLKLNASYEEFIGTCFAKDYMDTYIEEAEEYLEEVVKKQIIDNLRCLPNVFGTEYLESKISLMLRSVESTVESIVEFVNDDYYEDEFRENNFEEKELDEITIMFER